MFTPVEDFQSEIYIFRVETVNKFSPCQRPCPEDATVMTCAASWLMLRTAGTGTPLKNYREFCGSKMTFFFEEEILFFGVGNFDRFEMHDKNLQRKRRLFSQEMHEKRSEDSENHGTTGSSI